ncbi:hypothetical protein KVT40_001725 [Elsinoe batatas]|uniref:Uncharacterized protein n=1 Tax=Elsinoe batatas TaxID=2601811 RepID=A0A8K0PHJ4_9PEZI|nr:hypothetical protein KVT40_001725 [Elsinoe batatas]
MASCIDHIHKAMPCQSTPTPTIDSLLFSILMAQWPFTHPVLSDHHLSSDRYPQSCPPPTQPMICPSKDIRMKRRGFIVHGTPGKRLSTSVPFILPLSLAQDVELHNASVLRLRRGSVEQLRTGMVNLDRFFEQHQHQRRWSHLLDDSVILFGMEVAEDGMTADAKSLLIKHQIKNDFDT